LKVNGDMRQDGNTAEMTWDVGFLVRFVEERSSFECGDVMFTGSPAGTAQGSGKFLKPGDVVEAAVEGIGTLKNTVGPKSAA
jgi:2-keto-4-pentenoate hydratase/2-oxohepta-3-ene-1,7-dioic acid hydratase in catechol pathway